MSLSLLQLCLVFLLLTKIPDFTTTWQGLKERPTTDEQNPIARLLFEKLGIAPTFFLAACVYCGILLSIYVLYLTLPIGVQRVYLIMLIPSTLFIGIVQYQAAIYNKTGRMHFPLRRVYQALQWFYGRY